MGKTKNNRRKHKGEGPTGLPSVKDIEREEEDVGGGDEDSACPSDAALQNIIDHLQATVEDKVFALHSLASIFQNPDSVMNVVQRKVVRIAGPLLLDPSSAVRNAAAGALRNITSSGNHQICDLLVEQDIMTPLTALLHKYMEEWQLSDKVANSENADTFAQAVHLLWNLCEGNDQAVKYFNTGNLLPVLVKYISASPENLQITLAIVQCLMTLVEDNAQASNTLRKSEAQLSSLLVVEGESTALLLLRVLTTGVLLKVGSRPQGMLSPALLSAIVTPLMRDQREALHKLSSVEPGELADDQNALQEIGHLLEAQQIALELLTNLSADGDDEAMDLESTSTSSDDGVCDIDFSSVEPEFQDLNAPSMSLSPEVHEIVVSQHLVQKIYEKTRLPAENVCGLLHEHSGGQHLLKRVQVLRSRAFMCLNNLIPALDIQDLGGSQKLFEMWSDIAALVFKNPDKDLEVLEAASAAMRAALQKLAQSSYELSEIPLEDVEFIFSAGQNSDPSIRANVVKTASMLGMIALPQALDKGFQLLKCVGKHLLDICGHETELWVLAETFDSIMDLFGEDETDQVAAELMLVDRLQAFLPSFRRKVQVNKKKLGEHRALLSTVNTNLPRFIQYKSKRLALLHSSLTS